MAGKRERRRYIIKVYRKYLFLWRGNFTHAIREFTNRRLISRTNPNPGRKKSQCQGNAPAKKWITSCPEGKSDQKTKLKGRPTKTEQTREKRKDEKNPFIKGREARSNRKDRRTPLPGNTTINTFKAAVDQPTRKKPRSKRPSKRAPNREEPPKENENVYAGARSASPKQITTTGDRRFMKCKTGKKGKERDEAGH